MEIAIGILVSNSGQILMAQRPQDKIFGGFWEFPGGKKKSEESPRDALKRELKEELGIEADELFPWVTRRVSNKADILILHFYRVYRWTGKPKGVEGQRLSWESPMSVSVSPVLPANKIIIKFLKLPEIYGITSVKTIGQQRFFKLLDNQISKGLKFIQIREKELPRLEVETITKQIIEKCVSRGVIVVVNSDMTLAKQLGANGVHLSATMLRVLKTRPDFEWCGASCHSLLDLRKAADLKLDFVVLGAVLKTASHPHTRPIGWDEFKRMVKNFSLPVYAIGGMKCEILDHAKKNGAHGIGIMSRLWR